jgi:sugar lactone lactonase YvrE
VNGTTETLLDPGLGYKNGVLQEAKFDRPTGLSVDSDGSIIVADTNSHTVRRVSLSSDEVETLAGTTVLGRVDGNAATSRFRTPTGVTVDPETGTIYVSDNVAVIRTIQPSGIVSTLVGDGTVGFINNLGTQARLHNPQGLTFVSGSLYVADYNNHVIRRITVANRSVTTFAGSVAGAADGMGTRATLRNPIDIIWSAVDKILYVSDTGNHLIRFITPEGNVSTFAGATTAAFLDGVSREARFNSPRYVSLDTKGNLYVVDYNNRAVRRVLPDGNVTTLVRGTGTGNIYSWPKNFTLFNPLGITVSFDGTIYVTDAHSVIWSFVCPSGPMRLILEEPIYIEPPVNPWDDIAYEEPPTPSAPTTTSSTRMTRTTTKASISTKRTMSIATTVSNMKNDDSQTWLDKTVLDLPMRTFLIIASIALVFFLMAIGFGIYFFHRRGKSKRGRKYTATATDSSPTRSFILPINSNRSNGC